MEKEVNFPIVDDTVLGSVFEEELPWAVWPLPCPLGTCLTSPVSKACQDVGRWERERGGICLNVISMSCHWLTFDKYSDPVRLLLFSQTVILWFLGY